MSSTRDGAGHAGTGGPAGGVKPWHQPGKWLVNPAYWDAEAKAARAGAPARIHFIDCTLSEGDDCVGHQPNWNTRLGMIERLDAIGVGEITMPSHVTFSEERDLIKACRRMGVRTRLVAKGPGVTPPLSGDWRGIIDRHVDLGTEVISPIVKWSYADTLSDFAGALSKCAVVDAIGESVAYMKKQGVRVVPWMVDSMRSPVDTACLFFKAMADAGADGVYVVDSRGNSTPLATRVFIRRIREAVGSCDIYVQHHNDLGVATANAMAAVESGANWIDASVIGIGDRGGCVALEEAAVLFEMYGIQTGVKLDRLYDLCRYVQHAYGVTLPPWKPIAGANWNKEEGLGHLEGSTEAEATVGVSPKVVGRDFEAVIGTKILFGRERSSAHTDDPVFLRELLASWNMAPTEEQFQVILFRARAAVATIHDRHYLTFDEFRAIGEGVILAGRG
jgi:isopropylmalate/homocitrate/citramalate synthase